MASVNQRNTESCKFTDVSHSMPTPHLEHPKLSHEVRISDHGDGVVLLNISHGEIFKSNKVGARILALLSEERSVSEIVDQVSYEFSAPQDIVRADLNNFIGQLHAKGLLQDR